ncbi:MAG: hypothetical protein LBD46_05295 [Endomicrobium sp.]|jgi:hypothetical protein|nr:hypothetical protein [Endomicrobium sp.]
MREKRITVVEVGSRQCPLATSIDGLKIICKKTGETGDCDLNYSRCKQGLTEFDLLKRMKKAYKKAVDEYIKNRPEGINELHEPTLHNIGMKAAVEALR